MLNRQTGDWDAQLLNYTGISADQLPKIANYGDVMSGLAPGYASKWPSLSSVPFCLAVGDGAAANVGEVEVKARRASQTGACQWSRQNEVLPRALTE